MSLRINDLAPDFVASTTHGEIHFHDWLDDHWAVLFSHPKDFTPVCTTELGQLARMADEFARRRCKIIGLSIDTNEDHEAWKRDIAATQNCVVRFPIIADTDLAIARCYGMLPAQAKGKSCERNAVDNATVRTVYVIGPDRRIKLMLVYPMSTGRNFDELLRVLDALQLTAEHKVATPANWQRGEDVIIAPVVSNTEARDRYPDGWRTVTPYLRYVPAPATGV